MILLFSSLAMARLGASADLGSELVPEHPFSVWAKDFSVLGSVFLNTGYSENLGIRNEVVMGLS